ncbi:hypothetical protein [Candidatus Nitrososphaera gargensis]|uniref:hypothetical protein n=1 Tax=Candidatus Nitrososphaera gargensis TaxID=497727 RepID=UPI0011E51D65|nr:hypothetical protein [Candidatus Nitrososphaera gargensis]
MIIGSFSVLWLVFSLKSKIHRMMIGTFAALFVAAAITNYDPVLDGIALAALPAIVLLIIYNQYSRKILDNIKLKLAINYIAITGIIIGLISFTSAILSISSLSNDETLHRNYAHEIFLLFSSVSPILILLLLTSYPAKLLINFVSSVTGRLNVPAAPGYDNSDTINSKMKVIYLSIFVFISMMMVIIPHLPAINNDNQHIGVDTPVYNLWLNELSGAKDVQEYFGKAFVEINGGDRPLSLILMLAFQELIPAGNENNSDLRLEYLPLLLGPLLVLTTYLLTRELTMNDKTSLLAAFLTSVSYHVLIGVYAGFYSNWISLICGYLAFFFLLRFLRQSGAVNLSLYGILMILTLFSHVYTWSILAIVMGVFLAICITRWNIHIETVHNQNQGSKSSIIKKNAMAILIVLLCTVAIDIGRVALTGSSGGIERDLELGSKLAGIEQFALRWNNLTYGTTVYVGGLFANFLILGLGIYWLFTSKLKERENIALVIFLSIGILPFLFGDWVIQTRVFYNIPFQIPASIALLTIIKQTDSGLLRSIPIFIWLVAISLILVSNFHLVLPSP